MFRQICKKELKCRFYVRYNDDFIIVSESGEELEEIRIKIISFAKDKLSLEIPSEKTSLRKIGWGIDFLGFTILPEAVCLEIRQRIKCIQILIRRIFVHILVFYSIAIPIILNGKF